MLMRHLLRKLLAFSVCGLLTFQLAACGTIIYPERRGQTHGEIDPVIAILNGIGLLFFVVPGLVAFAIDFTTGAIYLPGGQRAKDKLDRMKRKLDGRLETRGNQLVLHLDPQQLTPETVALILREATGSDALLHRQDVQVRVLNGTEELAAEWALMQGTKVAMACY